MILAECVGYTVLAALWEYAVVRCLVRLTVRRKIKAKEGYEQAEYRRSLLARS